MVASWMFLVLPLLAVLSFLIGLAGLISGYYLDGTRLLRGAEARHESLRLMLASIAGLLLLVLIGGLTIHP